MLRSALMLRAVAAVAAVAVLLPPASVTAAASAPLLSGAHPTWSVLPRGGDDGSPMILRIRRADGSMTRAAVPDGSKDSTVLSDLLAAAGAAEEWEEGGKAEKKAKVKLGTGAGEEIDPSKTVSELGLSHGALVSVIPPPRPAPSPEEKKASAAGGGDGDSNRWDPFPSLAKSAAYSASARRARALSRGSRRGTSYSAISALRSSMHAVEPQPEGAVKRIYMCAASADRFKDGCTILPTKKQLRAAAKAGRPRPEVELRNRCALLLGTVATERADQKREKVRTSLSTPLYEREMCQVVKVQAVWEPPQAPAAGGGGYDARKLVTFGKDKLIRRALALADKLGLRPVGWIYSYSEDRHAPLGGTGGGKSGEGGGGDGGGNEDALPVFADDIFTGALLQTANMRSDLGRDEGKKFVTLAMDARTGSCEAFQLSDVSVQMVSEGVLQASSAPSSEPKKKGGSGVGRFVETSEPVLVDSQETTELDSVLCLVNTAMLSQRGTFAGKQPELGVKRGSGQLTAKSTKRILAALDDGAANSGTTDSDLLEVLCDFNVLMGLSSLLSQKEMDELCRLVKKWSRGQKRGTVVGKDLKLVLRTALGG